MLQTRFIVIEATGSCSAPKQLTEVMSNKLANIVEHLAATADIFLRESYKRVNIGLIFSSWPETSSQTASCLATVRKQVYQIVFFFQNGQEDAQQKE